MVNKNKSILDSRPKRLTKQYGLLQTINPLIHELAVCFADSHPGISVDKIAMEHALDFINTAPVITAFLDLDYRFLATSKPWHKWFTRYLMGRGQKLDSLIGYQINQFSSSFPTPILKAIQKSKKGKSVYIHLLEIETYYKQPRWIKLETFPWTGHHNNIEGIVIFCEDVTDHQKLLFDNQNLHHTNEMLQSFSLIFSHDLIQPLRQIYNHTYFIEEHIKTVLGSHHSLKNMLDPIKKCVNRARDLCEGIVFYCRHGNLTIHSEEVNLGEILSNISDHCFENTHINFKNLADPQIKLLANKTSIMQLFQNLLDNAIKHSYSDHPVITLTAKILKSGWCKFELHNNSYCPKKINRNKMFDAFQSSKENGAGLGLMICKKIVTAYGGNIVLRSSPLKGTTVSFTLPSCAHYEKEAEQYLPNKIESDESDHKILEIRKICG